MSIRELNKKLDKFLEDDLQLGSTDTIYHSLVFEVHYLNLQVELLEKLVKKYQNMYNDAMKSIDTPYRSYQTVEKEKDKAAEANEYLTLALDRLKQAKSELIKKQSILNKIQKETNNLK